MLLPSNFRYRRLSVIALLCLGMTVSCVAQTGDSTTWVLSGRTSLYAEYYSLSTEPTSFFYARRPAQLYRLFANPEIRNGSFAIPFTLMITAQQTNFSTSLAQDQSLRQFVQNPLNIVACEPRWKWLQLHLGSFTPRWSDLSAGDVQVFGLGADAQPGSVRISAFHGISQRGVSSFGLGSTIANAGSYERTMTGVKFGFGASSDTHVDFHVVHSNDDTSSVRTILSDSLIRPEEHLVFSLAGHFVADTGVTLRIEAAGGITSRNTRSDILNSSTIPDFPLFTERVSSRIDYAANAVFAISKATYGLKIQSSYIGAGFSSPAFPLLVPDRFEISGTPRVSTSSGSFNLDATLGYKISNISRLQATSLSQVLFSANTQLVASDEITVLASFSNFGIRNTAINDTQRIQNVSQYACLTPIYRFKTQLGQQCVSLNFTRDKYTDDNLISGRFTSNNTTAVMLNYSVMLAQLPLSGQASLSYLLNNSSITTLTTLTFATSASYALFQNALIPGLRVNYSSIAYTQGEGNSQILIGIICAARLSSATSLQLNTSINHFSFGVTRPSSYTENTVQLSVSTQF